MANEEVGILITAKNITGAAFRAVSNSLRGIDNQATGLQGHLNGIPRALRTSFQGINSEFQRSEKQIIGMNAGLLAVGATVGGVAYGFSQLSNSIGDAIDTQTEQVNQINTAVNVLGLASGEAESFVENLNKKIATLGKNLPTSSDNIANFARQITDEFGNAYKDTEKSIDDIQNLLVSASSKLALASDLAGTTTEQANTAIGAFLAGNVSQTSLASTYSFFQNSIGLRNKIGEGLTKAGVESSKDLTLKQRVDLLNSALEKAIPEASIERLQGTTKAKFSSFMDSLFNSQIGIFSIQRDLEPKIPGYQSVFSEFENTFDILIGDNGLLSEFARISGLGNNSFLTGFRSSVQSFNNFLTGVSDTFSGIDIGDFNAVAGNIGKYTAQFVNNFVDGLLNLPWGDILGALTTGIMSFFVNLDWKVYTGLAIGLVGSFLAPAITAGVTAIGAGFLAALAAAGIGLPAILVGAITLGIIGIGKLITSNWDAITKTVQEWSQKIGDAISSLFESILNSVKNLFSIGRDVTPDAQIQTYDPGIAYGFYKGHIPNNILTASGGLFNAIATENRYKPAGSNLVIANDSEAIFTPAQLKNLITNVSTRGGGNQVSLTISSGAIQINSSSGNPQQIAVQVINMIEQKLVSELDSLIG